MGLVLRAAKRWLNHLRSSQFRCHRLSHDKQIDVFVFFFSLMQANKSLVNLNLEHNNLGPEGGKALAKSLEVISIWMLSSYDTEMESDLESRPKSFASICIQFIPP